MTPQTHFVQADDKPISPIESIHQQTTTLPDRVVANHIPRKPAGGRSPELRTQTNWIVRSGEPTASTEETTSTVRSGTQPVELQYPQLKERTRQLLADLRDRTTARQSSSSDSPDVKSDHSNVSIPRKPLTDHAVSNLASRPTTDHTKLSSRTKHDLQVDVGIATYHDVTSQPLFSISSSDSNTGSPSLRSTSSVESLKPVVPLKPARRATSEGSPLKPGDIHPAFRTPIVDQVPLESPLHTPHQQKDLPEIDPTHQQMRNDSPDYEDEPRTPTTPVQLYPSNFAKPSVHTTADLKPHLPHEVSRFSWTTYTSTNADSPYSAARIVRDHSPSPPAVELPAPIAIRKRPINGSLCSDLQQHSLLGTPRSVSGPVVRKPLPETVDHSQFSVSTSSKASDMSKSLPPVPAELEAEDRIASLEAQIDALERRKRNIARIMHDLKQSLVKNPVTCDLWRRREIDKRLANQQLEMDDVANDIHELNLILHRARRKRDKDDNYEQPTGLWIKRVTS